MQLWIHYMAGDGGDSLANLLEHADNATAIDLNLQWRVHRYVDGEAKFWAPIIDQSNCFRGGRRPFLLENNHLNQNYINCVEQNKNIVVTAHDYDLRYFQASDCQHILDRNRRKLLLISRDPVRSRFKAVTKNLQEVNRLEFLEKIAPYDTAVYALYDRVVYIEDLVEDWHNIQDLASWAGLDLKRCYFDHWQQIVQQKIYYADSGIEHYQSCIDSQGVYRYQKVESSMSTAAKKIDFAHKVC